MINMAQSQHCRPYQNSEMDSVPSTSSDTVCTDDDLTQQYKYVCTCSHEPFHKKSNILFSESKYDMEILLSSKHWVLDLKMGTWVKSYAKLVLIICDGMCQFYLVNWQNRFKYLDNLLLNKIKCVHLCIVDSTRIVNWILYLWFILTLYVLKTTCHNSTSMFAHVAMNHLIKNVLSCFVNWSMTWKILLSSKHWVPDLKMGTGDKLYVKHVIIICNGICQFYLIEWQNKFKYLDHLPAEQDEMCKCVICEHNILKSMHKFDAQQYMELSLIKHALGDWLHSDILGFVYVQCNGKRMQHSPVVCVLCKNTLKLYDAHIFACTSVTTSELPDMSVNHQDQTKFFSVNLVVAHWFTQYDVSHVIQKSPSIRV